jgi:hypothetical protein
MKILFQVELLSMNGVTVAVNERDCLILLISCLLVLDYIIPLNHHRSLSNYKKTYSLRSTLNFRGSVCDQISEG